MICGGTIQRPDNLPFSCKNYPSGCQCNGRNHRGDLKAGLTVEVSADFVIDLQAYSRSSVCSLAASIELDQSSL